MNSVRQSGTIVKWDDEKGFGFIAPDAGAGDVFAHVKAVVGARRPVVGDRVFYFPEKDNQDRLRAVQVQFESGSSWSWRARDRNGISRRNPRFKSGSGFWSWRALALVLSAAFLAAQGLAAALGRITPIIPVVYAIMSAVTLEAHWHDKSSARHGTWRLSENMLHLLELFGGWPGALIAQQWLRHKTRKLSYQLLFWAIVAAHIGLWTWLATGK